MGTRALPIEVTSFVGRRDEVAAVGGLLRSARLVTLTGPGGVGKTRVAVRVAAGASFERVRAVELADVDDPGLVAATVAAHLDVAEAGGDVVAAEGAGLSLDEAIALALDERPPGPALTPREQQIADLVAAGMSNRAIAGELVISVRTVDTHVEHILRKLGVATRTQVAVRVATGRDEHHPAGGGVAPERRSGAPTGRMPPNGP